MTTISVKHPRVAWSPKEISEATGLSLPFVRLEIARNSLRAVRCGHRVLVTDAELQRYLAEGSLRAQAQQAATPDSSASRMPWDTTG